MDVAFKHSNKQISGELEPSRMDKNTRHSKSIIRNLGK